MRAVITGGQGDEVLALRLTLQMMVLARQLQAGFHGIGAAATEEGAGQILWREESVQLD